MLLLPGIPLSLQMLFAEESYEGNQQNMSYRALALLECQYSKGCSCRTHDGICNPAYRQSSRSTLDANDKYIKNQNHPSPLTISQCSSNTATDYTSSLLLCPQACRSTPDAKGSTLRSS